MSSSPAIHAQQLDKVFQLYDRPINRLKQMFARNDRRYYKEFVALRDVSFKLEKGEVLGLVGRNGAGKSTLLQLICGTLTPSSGSVAVHGRIAALLELGAGFNPEFTGRENIYLNASILGLSKAEIDERYDAIVDFSGISDFIHQPVKTYSSGMYVRLAFSIATSVDPDILVIDEALSVGDGAFARKSFDRIMTLKEKGATILFCSHSMYQIEALCTRALWLEKGAVQQMGNPATVVARYQTFLDRDAAQTSSAAPRAVSSPMGHARILAVQTRVDDEVGTSLEVRSGEQTLGIRVGFASDPLLPAPVVAVTLNAPDGRILASSSTHADALELARDESGGGTAFLEFPKIPLLKGEYFVWVYLLSENGIHIYDTVSNVATLHFSQQTLEQGLVALAHSWQSVAGAQVDAVSADPVPAVSHDPLDVLGVAATQTDGGDWLNDEQSVMATQHPALAMRLGLLCNEQGQWLRQVQPVWHFGWIRSAQENAWHDLFKASFGRSLSSSLWRWKYRDTERQGVGAWKDDQLQAFYGGMPRAISYFGQSAKALQISDAMVHPSQSDPFARNAPFHMAAATFAEQQLGDGRPHLVDFGFSESRHLSQIEALGLSEQVDAMTEMRWPALSGVPVLRTFARPLDESNAAIVDRLWMEMKRALQTSIVGVRDWAYVRSRYLMHPRQPYSVLLVRRRFNGAAVGILVLRDRQEQGVELVDFVAPPERFPELLDVGRRFAGKLGRSEVFTWITVSHVNLLAPAGGRQVALDLTIPANIWSPGPRPQELRGHWWLMAGDAGFR